MAAFRLLLGKTSVTELTPGLEGKTKQKQATELKGKTPRDFVIELALGGFAERHGTMSQTQSGTHHGTMSGTQSGTRHGTMPGLTALPIHPKPKFADPSRRVRFLVPSLTLAADIPNPDMHDEDGSPHLTPLVAPQDTPATHRDLCLRLTNIYKYSNIHKYGLGNAPLQGGPLTLISDGGEAPKGCPNDAAEPLHKARF